MAKALVTFEDFKRSWMRITSKGKHATLDAIYEDLGRRGSKSTLQKYRTRLLEELSDKGTEILPATIPPDMVPLIEEFFTKSVAIAGEVYQAHRKDLERQLESAFTENADLVSDLKESERIRAEQQSVIEALHNDKESLAASIEAKNQGLSELSEQVAVLKSEIESQARLHSTEMANLKAESETRYQALQDRFEAMQRQAADEKARADRAVQQADSNADHFLLQIEDERRKSAQLHENDQATIRRLDSQLTISQKREDGLSVKFSKLEERFLALQDEVESMESKHREEKEQLEREIVDLKAERKYLYRDNEQISKQLESVRVELNEARAGQK
jgi:chromosome segregation ATPase